MYYSSRGLEVLVVAARGAADGPAHSPLQPLLLQLPFNATVLKVLFFALLADALKQTNLYIVVCNRRV